MTFDGKNPNSVIILDNCSIHHVDGAVDAMQHIGTLIHFLPPYSPDYNPIELLFAKAIELELSSTDDIELIVLEAFSCITGNDCNSYVNSINIYN